ncbi:conserved hypothetical protein [Mycoplasma haemofelis str. Langford 1]|uniref:Conserved domain protein n=2 Tax=Mycoplasma haemofelis TaxID=29501 RepID=F6FHE8_MYCHI|nr:hypothetical protein [Mycoplasma haemofelis]AEG73778.1 conserved domain protein [Mycoplasma haemofelis Ohio2]CBY93483.1 conserved hypothetical protein [Mycoplasma haemofelis str. Langford 1]
MSSKIKSKKPIKFGKVLVITRLVANEDSIRSFSANIRRHRPQITEQELNEEIDAMVRKDNYYNAVMDEVFNAYEFELDEEEIKERVRVMSESYPNGNEESLRNMVLVSIYKKLIYDDLANDWELKISDEDVKSTLESFYKSTGQPIREYLMNRDKFNEVRSTLEEQLISDRLLNAFKADFQLKAPEEA